MRQSFGRGSVTRSGEAARYFLATSPLILAAPPPKLCFRVNTCVPPVTQATEQESNLREMSVDSIRRNEVILILFLVNLH